MAAQTEPRSELKHSWEYGEDGWNVGMDANLLRLGRFGFHLSIKDRALTTPPGSPADGDSYIVAASASGDWSGEDGNIAVWSTAGAAWVFGEPRIGWIAYIEDEEVISAYKAGGWSTGISI